MLARKDPGTLQFIMEGCPSMSLWWTRLRTRKVRQKQLLQMCTTTRRPRQKMVSTTSIKRTTQVPKHTRRRGTIIIITITIIGIITRRRQRAQSQEVVKRRTVVKASGITARRMGRLRRRSPKKQQMQEELMRPQQRVEGLLSQLQPQRVRPAFSPEKVALRRTSGQTAGTRRHDCRRRGVLLRQATRPPSPWCPMKANRAKLNDPTS
mmetsp:Transcript_51097/g.119636  ORF Transcript_51097/g.119636 Transcript_51097/m.119636 type:complete len:208 (-) Transcript_51097:1235-1858(-)